MDYLLITAHLLSHMHAWHIVSAQQRFAERMNVFKKAPAIICLGHYPPDLLTQITETRIYQSSVMAAQKPFLEKKVVLYELYLLNRSSTLRLLHTRATEFNDSSWAGAFLG